MWQINLKARTATDDSGVIFEFTDNGDGSWGGRCLNPELVLAADPLVGARLAREAGDAFIAALNAEKKQRPPAPPPKN